jgi:uncharacterized membrane-anchored protein
MTHVSDTYSKVPAVTLGFWIIKILATTLGETFGDTVTMTASRPTSWSTQVTASEVRSNRRPKPD